MAISLYIHFPFCTNKCHYCDFYKEVHKVELEKSFYKAIDKEIALASARLSDRSVSTIFIGGGTPSLTDLNLFEKMIAKLHEHFEVFPDVEFSMECNPESVSLEVLERLQKLGITRPTYGMQSFDTKVLETLGRRHDPHQSQQAVYFSNALGFKTFGTDLIFGVPKQTGKILSADIDQLIDLNPPHISYYQLTIEEGTRMYDKVSKGLLTPLEQELVMAMYKSGVERFQQAGYVRYEVCSFAKPGHECRHNIGYWEGRDYLGLGPSAHSFINGQRFLNASSNVDYVKALENGELPREVDDSGIEERMVETILLGLRTTWGVSRAKFERVFENKLEEKIDLQQYDTLVKAGHLVDDGDAIKLSDDGFYIVEEVTRRLVK